MAHLILHLVLDISAVIASSKQICSIYCASFQLPEKNDHYLTNAQLIRWLVFTILLLNFLFLFPLAKAEWLCETGSRC
jgi:hypothetical protein